MKKLVFVTKSPEELTEGINVLDVAYTTYGNPSAYNNIHNLGCISVPYEGESIEPSSNGINKFEADVNVIIDNGFFSFSLVGEVREKENIEATPEFIAYIDKSREEEYALKVDKLVLEKLRKSLKDPEIDAIVEEIKKKYPK